MFAAQHGAWFLFGLTAGTVADRHPPARVIAIVDAVRVVVFGLLLVLVAFGLATVPLLVGLAVPFLAAAALALVAGLAVALRT